jgi:hypothetical protein
MDEYICALPVAPGAVGYEQGNVGQENGQDEVDGVAVKNPTGAKSSKNNHQQVYLRESIPDPERLRLDPGPTIRPLQPRGSLGLFLSCVPAHLNVCLCYPGLWMGKRHKGGKVEKKKKKKKKKK